MYSFGVLVKVFKSKITKSEIPLQWAIRIEKKYIFWKIRQNWVSQTKFDSTTP